MTLTQIKPAGLSKPVDLADNEQIRLGTSNDLLIYHDGSNSVVRESGTGQLQLESNTNIVLGTEGIGETYAKFVPNGAVELYHNNSKKFETTSAGNQIFGNLVCGTVTLSGGGVQIQDDDKFIAGNGDDLQLYHNGNHSYLRNSTGIMHVGGTGGDLILEALGDVRTVSWEGENMIYAKRNGAVELYYDNSKKFETIAGGVSIPSGHLTQSYGGISSKVGYISGGAEAFFGSTSNHALALGVNDDEKVRIKTDGDVQIKRAAGGSTQYLTLSANYGSGGDQTLTASSNLRIYTGGSNERIRVLGSNGYVGIGTTSPDNILHLESASNPYLQLEKVGTSSKVYLGNSAGEAILESTGAAIKLKPNGRSNDFVLGTSGLLGIGTASPARKLHVRVDNTPCAKFGGEGGSAYYMEVGQVNTSSSPGFNATGSGTNFLFQINGTERLRIRNTGGICFNGDTAAANALDDYEEGTWTPSFNNFTNVDSTNVRQKLYTKIGNTVHLWLEVFAENDIGWTDSAYISGTPYSGTSAFPNTLYIPVNVAVMYGGPNYSMDQTAAGRSYYSGYSDKIYLKMGTFANVRHIWLQLTYRTNA